MLLVPKEKSGEIWWRLSRIINNFEYNNVYNLLVISQVQDRLRNFIYRYIIPCISPMTTPRSRNYYPYFTHKEIQRECLWNSLRLYLVKGKEQAIAISLTVSLLIESQGWISKLTTVQFSSVAQLWPILCDPMDLSTSGLPVHHQLLKFTQAHVHWVSDSIKPSHPLLSPSPPAFNVSQHEGLFQWVSSSHQVAKVLEVQHQSFQWIFRTDFL